MAREQVRRGRRGVVVTRDNKEGVECVAGARQQVRGREWACEE